MADSGTDTGSGQSLDAHKRIAKNTIYSTVSSVVTLFLSFLFFVALARYLGVGSYGLFVFAGSFTSLFYIFFDLGLNSLNIREVARYKEKSSHYFSNSLAIESISSLLVIGAIYSIALALGYRGETLWIILLSAIILGLEALVWLVFSMFIAHERREYEATITIFGKGIYVALGFLGIFLQYPLFQIVILFVVSSVIKLLLGYGLLVRKMGKPSMVIDTRAWQPMIKLAFPFAMGGFLFNIYNGFSVDMTILSFLKGNEAVAYYSVPYRFISLFIIVPAALSGSVMPVLSRLHIHSRDSLVKTYSKITRYLLMLSVPIAIGMFLISDIAILTLFGEKYTNSVLILQILAWIIIFLFINYFSGSVLNAIDKPMLMTYGLLGYVILNIILDLILIPPYSYIGASITAIITEIVLLGIYSTFLAKNGIPTHFLQFTGKPLIGGIVMGTAIYGMKILLGTISGITKLMVIIPLAAGIYFITLYAIRTFNEEDRAIISSIIGQRAQNLINFRR